MRTFDYVFPGTPNLPSQIQPAPSDVAVTAEFIRTHFADAAASLCSALGITLPVSTSPEVVEPAAATPGDGWKVAGGSDTPSLSPARHMRVVA